MPGKGSCCWWWCVRVWVSVGAVQIGACTKEAPSEFSFTKQQLWDLLELALPAAAAATACAADGLDYTQQGILLGDERRIFSSLSQQSQQRARGVEEGGLLAASPTGLAAVSLWHQGVQESWLEKPLGAGGLRPLLPRGRAAPPLACPPRLLLGWCFPSESVGPGRLRSSFSFQV